MGYINKKTIAKNSAFLYIRVLATLLISLWTTRFILRGLGVVDYGIYNVVAGFVVMFGVISNTLSAAISRYVTFELGTGNLQRLRVIFKSSMTIQLLIVFLVLLAAETLGVWFVNNKLNIPANQLIAANWVFQFSVLAFLIDLIKVPYNALLIGYEKMDVFAILGIVTAVGKLLISILILYVSGERLIIYSGLLFIVSLLILIYSIYYTHKNFSEVFGEKKYDFGILKEVFSFAGWNFIGSISGLCRDQGVNILLNIFFGPVVNAARGIAMQVSGAATTFANNIMMAVNPQITKAYASGDVKGAINLSNFGTRMGFAFMITVSTPILLNTPFLLKAWLGSYPEYSVPFVRLIIINAIIDVLSTTTIILLLATGKIKLYQIVVGSATIMNLPLSYCALKLGFSPLSTIYIAIITSIATLILRLVFLKKEVKISLRAFNASVFSKILLATILTFGPLMLLRNMDFISGEGIGVSILNISICIAWSSIVSLSIMLESFERQSILRMIRNRIHI